MASARRATRASHLLSKVVATRWFDPDALAAELVVSVSALDGFLTDRIPIPLDRQLTLALLVIEKMPPLARLGHQLHAQVRAAIAYETQATSTHASPPPGMPFA
jgi:hypothetical protein